ncbi:MAG TPA: chemotaxis response regulator protein-glutamate methylesterase, partial [Candidatus Diapherotrites archaeon]|nr:chemotaxis response regulator protein-glutamate methylesterase [Candidatus Diapherotrites archaeon]
MITQDEGKIRVLIIDDSAFMRVVISDMIKSDADIEVAGTARNGKEGLEKAILLKPDIITLDIEMPVMNGLETLTELMKLKPVPKVIILSNLSHEGGEAAIRAFELGALDYVVKPVRSFMEFDAEQIREELINKIKSICRSKTVYFPHIKSDYKPPSIVRKVKYKSGSDGYPEYIVAIGASTGGPKALQEIVTKLPEDIPAAVLIVQHMPPGFTKSLANRLDSLSMINVKEAEDGDVLASGWAYIAPGSHHMLVKSSNDNRYKILLNKEAPENGHRPSVSVMMKSVAETGHNNIIAAMLTGMGSDGSDGILEIKKAGGKTIAQDERTCVVYGM